MHFDYTLQTSDSLDLYGQGWKPEGPFAGLVCLVHGLGEHSGRYRHLAEYLNRQGYALIAFDLRGHGKSQGPRGHADSFEAIFTDIDHFLQYTKDGFPDRRIILYGHSFGGSLVINYALRRKPDLAGLIATGPGLRPSVEQPKVKIALGHALKNVLPALTLSNGLDIEGISRDPEVVRVYLADPLVHDRISTRLGIELLQNGEWAIEHAGELPLPLLIMHGGADRLAAVQGSKDFCAKAGNLCTLKVWEGLFHEIHNEPEQNEVFDYMMNWIQQQDTM